MKLSQAVRIPRSTRFLHVVVWIVQAFAIPCVRAEEVKNSVGMTLRMIEAGRFERGEQGTPRGFEKDHARFNPADDDRPLHPVVITRPFYMATTEVTVAQFRQFLADTRHTTSAESNSHGAVGWDPRPPADHPNQVATFREGSAFTWKNPGFQQADDHPVVSVSYLDARAYCDWLSKKENAKYRLPTEAEWEYAARAGTSTWFSFGDDYRDHIHQFANIGNVELEKAFPGRVLRQWLIDVDHDPGDRHVFTAPVASYKPNPWGLYDLSGNVWEWCQDLYLDTAYSEYERKGYQQVRKRAIDPVHQVKSASDGDWRVIRGGSWFNAPIQCRSSVRGFFEANDAACYVGFRVVRDAPAAAIESARHSFEKSEAARSALERYVGPFQERRDGRLTLLVRHEHFNDDFFKALQELDEPVDIHVDCHGRIDAVQLARLGKAKQLRGLALAGIGEQLTDRDFAVLEKHKQLELLELLGASQFSDGLLSHFKDAQQLQTLRLQGERITDAGLKTLPPFQKLTVVGLENTASQGLVLAHFRSSPLERFSCSRLTDEGARLLVQFPRIRDVSISGSSVTGRGLADIVRLTELESLNLSDCRGLKDDDFVALGSIYGLRHLHLQQTSAGDRAVGGLARLNNLRSLRIGSDQLSNEGLRRICEIVSLDTLGITSEATRLTDAALTDLWRLANLRTLEVSAPQITGTGFETLSELAGLEWLSLSSSGFGDAALANVARSRSLQRLFIGHHQEGGARDLSDQGLSRLGDAERLTHLELILRGTSVTEAGLADLRKRRPALTVHARQ